MIPSLPKTFFVLGVVLFSLGHGSTLYTARPSEGERTPWISATHRHTHSLGQVRPVKEAPAAPNPAAYGHHYVPGQHRPVLTHTTESTTESKSVGARQHNPSLAYPSYDVSIQDLNATGTTLITRTGVRSMTAPAAYSYAPVTLGVTQNSSPDSQSNPPSSASASATETGAASGLHDYQSVTTAVTRESSVASPQSETLTGPLWTLPACNGPSPGPGLTPVGCTFASSAAASPQPTPTYSWSEVNNLSSTSEARQGDSLHSQASTAAVTASTQSPTNSQSWTFDSTPCAGNKDFECVVVNGSSTVTLGPISQILGLGAATLTASSRPTSGNHLQNWTANSTPCVGNTSFECVDTDSGIATLGHKASLKFSQISTSNSTPCADNKSFECVVNGSSTITLGPIASLTAPPNFPNTIDTLSTTNGLLTTILSDLGLLGLSSTTLPSVANPRGGMTTAPSSLSRIPVLTPCTSNASLDCLVQGTQTFVGGSLGLPTQTAPPNGIPCAQNTTLECVVQGSRAFTVGKLPPKTSISSSISSFKSQSTTTVALTLPPFTSSTSTGSPHDPYPYPRASGASVKRFKIPTILIILCSLAWIVASVDLPSISYLVGRGPPNSASTSTDINYGPLVTSLAAVSGSTVPVDGNYGIGAPPATTSTAPADGNWGIGVPPATIATMSAPPPIGSSSGKSISPDAAPASTTLTHAVSGSSSSFSPFPTNFIQPVTGSGTEAPEMRSSPPLLSKTAQSGSSRLRSPCFLFLLSCIFLHVAATGVPTPTLHSETRSGSTLERSTKTIPPISPRQDPLRSNFLASQTITIPATNGSPNRKPPFLLILLASLVSMRAATMTVAPRGALLPSLCAGQTDTSSASISSTATSASSAPSKTATSGSSKTKIPSLLLVLSSFFENAWAGLFRPAPTVERRAAEERAAQLEAMTASLPPTSASISPHNREAAKTLVIVQSSVVTVIEPTETASQGLRKTVTPFLLFMLYCIAATLYTASSQRKRDRTREGYKDGNTVVYPAETDFDASGYK